MRTVGVSVLACVITTTCVLWGHASETSKMTTKCSQHVIFINWDLYQLRLLPLASTQYLFIISIIYFFLSSVSLKTFLKNPEKNCNSEMKIKTYVWTSKTELEDKQSPLTQNINEHSQYFPSVMGSINSSKNRKREGILGNSQHSAQKELIYWEEIWEQLGSFGKHLYKLQV